MTRRDIRTIEASGTTPAYAWLDREWVLGRGVEAWEELLPPAPPGEDDLHILRSEFSPEVIVPAAFVARARPRRHRTAPALADYLLDYEQEAVLKSDLDLVAEGSQLSRDFSIQLINGVAGSGKTLILLYRLRLLQSRFPRKAYQVLTHNRPLIHDMRARYAQLNGAGVSAVGWNTFMRWCRRQWPKDEAFEVLPDYRRARLVRAIWAEHLRGSGVSLRMLQGELGWVKDLGIARHEDYMEAGRQGRGFRLTQQQRETLFEAMQAYQHRLGRLGMMDWWDVPRRYWHWLQEGRIAPPHYDVVLVDEAQFFAPVWFDVVRAMVTPEVGYLMLAADPTQGFLRRGASWRSVAGVDMRGRSHVLRRSYRTTRAIMALALAFYRLRLPENDPDVVEADLGGMPAGPAPVCLKFGAPQDERAEVVKQIEAAVARGLPRRHVLILHSSARAAGAMVEALNEKLGVQAARDPKDEPPGDFIRVTTLNAGTGLESPVVFAMGLQELFEAEYGLRLDEDDRAELVEAHTRQLYMAFTRAGQRLILTVTGELPPSLQQLAAQGLVDVDRG